MRRRFRDATSDGDKLSVYWNVSSIDPIDETYPRAVCEAAMLTVAALEQSSANLDTGRIAEMPPVQVEHWFVDPSGTTLPASVGAGRIVRYQAFDAVDAATLESAVGSAVAELDVNVVSTDTLQLIDSAVAIVVEKESRAQYTPDVITELAGAGLTGLAGIDPQSVEGYYIELRDETGRAVWATWAANRAAAGGNWVHPDFFDAVNTGSRPPDPAPLTPPVAP